MDDLLAAIGLVFVLEGALYALFPNAMVDMLRKLPSVPVSSLRFMGITSIIIGWFIIWLIRS